MAGTGFDHRGWDSVRSPRVTLHFHPTVQVPDSLSTRLARQLQKCSVLNQGDADAH
jgi:hypothetical protein